MTFAYQEGKGILDAVMKAQSYINEGNIYSVTIDVEGFFDHIDLHRMYQILSEKITDEAVLHLMKSYMYCKILKDDQLLDKKLGLLQGNSISPILSNMYLHGLDIQLEEAGYHWIRFGDDIHVYVNNQEEAGRIFIHISSLLKDEYHLSINEKKSGVYPAMEHMLLGYDFYRYNNKIEVRRHKYQKIENYNNWHRCAIEKINSEYHILKDGVLNKHDYALLFENDKEKQHIPVETLDLINIYSDVTIGNSALRLLINNNIKVRIIDKYGNSIGTFIPEGYEKDSKTLLKQVEEYVNKIQRVEMARKLELSGLHNMRANLRYYHKKSGKLDFYLQHINAQIEEIKNATTVEDLMLIEARARQNYYQSFNDIIQNNDFAFSKRSKRPPKDEINALISFGNTMLYNKILQLIWNTSLNPQIGIIHAANRRQYSLNLDFADLFKPIIVDRVIFTLIHRLQIKKTDFEKREDGGVYLTESGKRTFVIEFNQKMQDKLVIKGWEMSYQQLIQNEVRNYQKHLMNGSSYKPYKYY